MRLLVNNAKMWTEMVVTEFEVLSPNLAGGPRSD
jgi:hypothetical protein